jgi:putative ABC transport system permease protein
MGILGKKILRYIGRNLGQFLAAAAVVMGGVIVYIAMSSSYYSLSQSRDHFYRENNFADYYFQVVKAPQSIVRQIELQPGIKRVTGRVQSDLYIIKANNERATARVVGYNLPMDNKLNRLTLAQGRFFSEDMSNAEVVVDPKYLKANLLNWGDQVRVVADGKEVIFTVVGAAISPEFIYAMKDSADILPDPTKFGIFMMENSQAQQILNMPGQFNQVLIEFESDADQSQVVAAIEEILRPYGLLTSYPRQDQLSHAVLEAELDGIRSITTVLPAIFLLIAATIQFVILRRIIKAQRSQIGLMKGLGYFNYHIILHYLFYALAVSLAGAVGGTILGVALSSTISQTYAAYFNLPGGMPSYNLSTIVNGIIMCLACGVAAGITASWRVVKIQPAQSMRPEPPAIGTKSLLEYWPALWSRLTPGWKMTLRNINRNRSRFAVTFLGVAFAVSLLVMSFFTNDAFDYLMKRSFYEGQTYDIIIRFNSLLPERELLNISRIDAVQKVEPFMELPVRINYQGRSEDEVLLAYGPELSMKTIEGTEGQVMSIPEKGMLINHRTAVKLGLKPGAEVEVQTRLTTGPVHKTSIKVIGESRQLVGAGSYIDLIEANRILLDRNLVSGAMIKVIPGHADQVEALLNEMLGVASIMSRQKEIDNFEKNLEVMFFSISIMVLFAVMLGFAIVYNSSIMNMAERTREISSMRVIGFHIHEISALLMKENILHAVMGGILGLLLGRYLAEAYVESVSTDLYTLPVVIYPRTYIMALLAAGIFVFVAHLFSVRKIKKIDLVEALKSAE